MPALPLDEAGKYVAGAYIVFVALILIYVSIMAAKLARIERDLGELAEYAEKKNHGETAPAGPTTTAASSGERKEPAAKSREVEAVAEQMRN